MLLQLSLDGVDVTPELLRKLADRLLMPNERRPPCTRCWVSISRSRQGAAGITELFNGWWGSCSHGRTTSRWSSAIRLGASLGLTAVRPPTHWSCGHGDHVQPTGWNGLRAATTMTVEVLLVVVGAMTTTATNALTVGPRRRAPVWISIVNACTAAVVLWFYALPSGRTYLVVLDALVLVVSAVTVWAL
jgi:hypothetical protein